MGNAVGDCFIKLQDKPSTLPLLHMKACLMPFCIGPCPASSPSEWLAELSGEEAFGLIM
jgi:hypothetical protein